MAAGHAQDLEVITAKITAKGGQLSIEMVDLRPNDLLELVVHAAGVDHTIFRLFVAFNSHQKDVALLTVLKRDGHYEYWQVPQVKKIRLLARDAKLAFDVISSLEERHEYLKELLQSAASRTEDFAQDIKRLCDRY